MRILIFLLLSITAAAQTTDITYSIDSVAAAEWYFSTTNTVTLSSGDKSIQGYRRFFDNKDSVLAYANRQIEAVKIDSALARRSLLAADSSKHRIGRAIYGWDNTFSGARTTIGPPIRQQAEADKPKAVQRKRVKNVKSKQ